MVGNKNRLYIALYPSGVVGNEERKYHWGFLIGPKDESYPPVAGTRYHVKHHPLGGWIYEEADLRNVQATNNLLARIVIAKIADEDRLINILRRNPVVNGDPEWRCRSWVAQALATIAEDGRSVGTAQLDWGKIERVARKYVRSKTESGRYAVIGDPKQPKPTYDMLEGKEAIS
ncbi:unnamed protein product [Clonostachys rosea f. rosea IK726]|uniref:Uncharacterized protein n=2 Tax=Bionectria ochroleuca TaxID=29856 RepID=A0ACA9TVI7_BIOOC|nr:unnamed protein product [Clonostachys rosea f. rosea IK726]